ncbi:MAG: FixH family protein [Planctomycetes bacterium]|nr:FixH family protein [Planctomycetota bacterium]
MKPRRGRFWPLFIAALLAVPVVGDSILIYCAARERSFAVEPDYYRRGLAWDRRMEQERENLRLGWRLRVRPLERAAGGSMPLEIRVLDVSGAAIRGANLELTVFHRARRADARNLSATTSEGGAAIVCVPAARRGRWALEAKVEASAATFTATAEWEVE